MADTAIGEGSHSISQEARKKVSIAVELVSKPGLLFLDEPSNFLFTPHYLLLSLFFFFRS